MTRQTISQPDFAISEADLAVFQQSWWLELARGDADYRQLRVYVEGVVVGNLTFIVVTNKLGNKLGFPPIWSHLGGPVISKSLDEERRVAVIRQLIAQLPKNISFRFVCNFEACDSDFMRQEFRSAGFQCLTETTYLQYPEDDGILDRVSGKSKRKLVSAARKLEIVDLSPAEFISFYESNLAAVGKRSYASLRSAHDLISVGQRMQAPQMRVIGARQNHGGAPLDAAIAYAWDKNRYYLWMTTHREVDQQSESKPHPHAGKLLILHGTEDARRRGLIFDADGAITEGNQTLYRDILRFPRTEARDVFVRDTNVYAIYKRARLALGLRPSRKRN